MLHCFFSLFLKMCHGPLSQPLLWWCTVPPRVVNEIHTRGEGGDNSKPSIVYLLGFFIKKILALSVTLCSPENKEDKNIIICC